MEVALTGIIPTPAATRSHCKFNEPNKFAQNAVVAAATFLICSTSEASVTTAEERSCKIVYVSSSSQVLDIGSSSDAEVPPVMMAGMSAKNFDPARYAGRWFEVASLKRGFAGAGQGDCHCTQGVYRFDEPNKAIDVDTFCVHGSPDGYITGIRGKVQCITDSDLRNVKNELERAEMTKEKCYLRFPTLPFIPKEPYDVLATDYDTYALVSGAKNFSFVQIYSRIPNPGPEFIDKYKAYLGDLGYDQEAIIDTPQDCEYMSMDQLMAMMSSPGMEQVMTNTFPPLELRRPVQFDPFTSILDTLKKLVKLYVS